MIQLSTAIELNVGGRASTLAFGWGWDGGFTVFRPLRMGQPGISRVGVIILGFFVTYQRANMNELQKQLKLLDLSRLKKTLNAGTAPKRVP